MSLHALAGHMATKGRGGDSMLVHMSPREVASLQVLAVKNGTSLTINPDTGLPEALSLKSILPALAGIALGPAGFGLMSGAMAGVAVGGVTALATGSLSRGLMAGMGAYGASGLAEGLMGAGAGAAQGAAMSGLTQEQIAAQMAEKGLTEQGVLNQAAADATSKYASSGFGDRLAQGASAAYNDPKAFVQGMGGVGKLAQSGLAALSPIFADQGVQTTTKRSDTGNVRRYSFDPYGQTYTSQGVYPATEEKGMAQGGIIALAAGGVSDARRYAEANNIDLNKQINAWTLANPNASDAMIDRQMQQYGISNEDVAGALKASGGSKAMEWNTLAGNQGLSGLNTNINSWLQQNPGATRTQAEAAMAGVDLNEADVMRATGKSLSQLFGSGPLEEVPGGGGDGVSGGGDTDVNPNGTITTTPNIPGRPEGGFTGMGQLRDIYEQRGGSLGYENPYAKDMEDFNARFRKQTGSSRSAYDYLMGEGAYPTKSSTPGLMRPYGEETLGIPAAKGRPTQKYIFQNGRYIENPDFIPVTYDSKGNRVVGVSNRQVLNELEKVPGSAAGGLMQRYADGGTTQASLDESRQKLNSFLQANNVSHERIASLLNISVEEAKKRYPTGDTGGKNKPFDTNQVYGGYGDGHVGVDPNNLSPEAVTNQAAFNLALEALALAPQVAIGAIANAFSPPANPDNLAPVVDMSTPAAVAAAQAADAVAADNGTAAEGGNTVGNANAAAAAAAQGVSVADSVGMDGMGAGSVGGTSADGTAAGNSGVGGWARGGPVRRMALGGLGALAGGGQAGYNLGGYSDGGRLLRGPGDGVSDSIPATIGNRQPARLADGEFVVPARIVSELGNGSTEAGARKLYAMMDRVQKARGKTTGKKRVAANTRSEKYLPA
jgi:hypothetical protein